MTVSELIEILENEDKDKEIYFTYPAGDYWHTTIAKPIKSIEEGYVEKSDYHRAFKTVEEPEDEQAVVLLIS